MMRNKKMTLLMLLALGFGAFILANRYVIAKASPTGEKKQKWEYCRVLDTYRSENNQYKTQIISPSTQPGQIDEIDSSYGGLAALNKLGAEGWEIVGIVPHQSSPEYMMKRPKS